MTSLLLTLTYKKTNDMNNNSVTHDSPPPLPGLSKVKTEGIYFTEDLVLRAEILGTVRLVTNHQSLENVNKHKQIFQRRSTTKCIFI